MSATKQRPEKAHRMKSPFGKNPCDRTVLRTPVAKHDGKNPLSPCRRVVTATLAAAIAGSIGFSGSPALAEENGDVRSERTTTVSLQGTVSQLSVSVPTSMPVKVKGDGNFIETGIQIQNNSIFDVHVSAISTQAEDPFNIVSESQFEQSDDRNVLWMTLSAGEDSVDLGSASVQETTVVSSEWNVSRAESGSNVLSIVSNGAIKNADNVTSEQEEALQVSFTIEAGSN